MPLLIRLRYSLETKTFDSRRFQPSPRKQKLLLHQEVSHHHQLGVRIETEIHAGDYPTNHAVASPRGSNSL